ncbi:hypothetical protein HYS11_01040 [Candidatus Gottesmanbacteria bacterium]|nr:hypothetical protein [Candidatus Gottesmanbacteria bacterium]
MFEVAVGTQKVQAEYTKLSEAFGGEFSVLLKTPKEEIEKLAGERIAEAVHKVRIGDIKVDPGYDGVFGKVKIWKDEIQKKTEDEKKQLSLF